MPLNNRCDGRAVKRPAEEGQEIEITPDCSESLFAGMALEGATLRQDLDDNIAIDGRKIGNREIVNWKSRMPPEAARVLGLSNKYSAHEEQYPSAL